MSLSDLMIDYQTEVAEKGDYVHNKDEEYKDFGEYVSKVMKSDEYKRDMDEYHAKFDDKNGGDAGEDWKKGHPIRVVRGYKGKKHSKYAPEEGCRYDGGICSEEMILLLLPGHLRVRRE